MAQLAALLQQNKSENENSSENKSPSRRENMESIVKGISNLQSILVTSNRDLTNEVKLVKRYTDRTSRNTSMLPLMIRSIRVMQLSIEKLVNLTELQRKEGLKLNKSFFEKQTEEENKFESQRPSRVVPTTDVKPKEKEESKGSGFLDTLLSFVPGLLKGLLVGGAITAIIGKLAENQEFKESLKTGATNLIVGIFNALKTGFNFFKELISENKDKIGEAMSGAVSAFFSLLKEILTIKVGNIAGIDVNLGEALGATVVAIIGFKAAVIAATGAILKATLGLGGGRRGLGGPGRGGKGGKGIKGALGKGAGLLGRGALLYGGVKLAEGLLSDDEEASDINQVQNPEMGSVPKQDTLAKTAGTAVAAGAGAYAATQVVKGGKDVAKNLVPKTAEAILDARTISVGSVVNSNPTTKWGKFLKFLAKRNSKLWQKIGVKLAQSAALAAIPFAGWIMAAINLGFNLWMAWDLYEMWIEFNNSDELDDKKVSEPTDQKIVQQQTATPTKVPEQTSADVQNQTQMSQTVSSQSTKTSAGSTSSSQTAPTKVQSIGTNTSAPSSAVSFIAKHEGFSAKAYRDGSRMSIGYGTDAKGRSTITKEEAQKELEYEVARARNSVLSMKNKGSYDWNQNQIDALTSFTYNLGPGGLNQLTAGGKRTNEQIMEAMPKYINFNGSPSKGLLKRRNDELELFKNNISSDSAVKAPSQTVAPTSVPGTTDLGIGSAAGTTSASSSSGSTASSSSSSSVSKQQEQKFIPSQFLEKFANSSLGEELFGKNAKIFRDAIQFSQDTGGFEMPLNALKALGGDAMKLLDQFITSDSRSSTSGQTIQSQSTGLDFMKESLRLKAAQPPQPAMPYQPQAPGINVPTLGLQTPANVVDGNIIEHLYDIKAVNWSVTGRL